MDFSLQKMLLDPLLYTAETVFNFMASISGAQNRGRIARLKLLFVRSSDVLWKRLRHFCTCCYNLRLYDPHSLSFFPVPFLRRRRKKALIRVRNRRHFEKGV